MFRFSNQYKQTAVVAALLLFLGGGHANAITMPSQPLSAPITADFLSINDPEILRNSDYEEIVRLLNVGQRDQANLKIANILIKRPGDKTALELAGITLLQMQKFKAAEESFRRLVDQPPVKPSVITKYAIVKIINGDIDGGSKLLRQLLEFAPEDTLAMRYLAWVEERDGNIPAAIGYLKMLPRPEQAGLREYHAALARSYDAVGDYTSVIELLGASFQPPFLQLNPANAEGAFYLVHAYAAVNSLGKAEELAIALKPLIGDDRPKLFLMGLGLAMGKGEVAKAENMVNAFIQDIPEGASFARYEFAQALLQANELIAAVDQMDRVLETVDERELPGVLGVFIPALLNESMQNHAVAMLERVVAKYPQNERLAYNLADIQSITGRKQDALNTLSKLTGRKEPFQSALLLAGRISRELGEHQDARQSLSQYVKLMPANPQGWVSLAGVYYDLNEMEKAQEILRQAISENPEVAVLAYELGTLYQVSGQLELANEQYELALAQDAGYIQAMDNLASNLLDMNQAVDKARGLAEKVYAALPNAPYIQDLWGWALYRSGELNEAKVALQMAAKGVTDSGRADYHLALTLRDLGEEREASKHFKLALDKGLPEALRAEVEGAISASR